MRVVAPPTGPSPSFLLLCVSGPAQRRFHGGGGGGGGVVVVGDGELLVLLSLQLALVEAQRPLQDIFNLIVETSMLDKMLINIYI